MKKFKLLFGGKIENTFGLPLSYLTKEENENYLDFM